MMPGRRRVMLVEDSPTQAERLRSLLEQEGMDVTHVTSAEEGLARFESSRPELVLLDYHLPGMNGGDFCREIRLNINTRAVPVLILTVDRGDEAETRGLDSGADDYLEKSADPDVLVARVRGLLRKSEGFASIVGEAAFSPARILVISQNPGSMGAIEEDLRHEHYQVQRAGDSSALPGGGGTGSFDCILLDCGNGLARESVEALRAEVGPSPALLLLVERENKQQMMTLLEAGADEYIARSVDPALLRARVRALLRRKALLDENRRIAEELAEKRLQALRARAEKEAAELRATMADRLEAANLDLEAANRKLQEALVVTKAITDNAADALFLLNRDGLIEFVSPAAARIFGYEIPELLQRPFHATLHHHRPDGRDYPAAECPAWHAILTGGALTTHDDVFFRKDGGKVDVAYSISPVSSGREVTGAVAVVHDVTERKRAEERLRQAQELERVGLLAGGIAHDFNNLLVGVIGNASLAADLLPKDHAAHEMLGGIVKAGETAAHLTRQLLAYAGKGRFLVQPVSLSAVARDARVLIGRSISNKITFATELDPKLPAVETDPSQMQQVMMNLVLNAAEAIGDRPGTITVTTGVAELSEQQVRDLEPWPIRPGRHVFVEVGDTGSGMDEQTKSRVFEPFFTTKFHGRGLGLAAVAGIVRGHQGAIEIETAPGRGSRFRVWLPAASAPARVPGPAPAVAADLSGRGLILVVDDEPFVRELARRALQRRGYEVLTADSGEAAIHVLAERAADVKAVVLDLSMPGMSGQDTLPKLRQSKPDLRVIVSSGYNEDEALRIFGGTTVSGFLQKPYTVQDLALKIKEALDS